MASVGGVGNAYDGIYADPRNHISNLERIIGRIPNHIKNDLVENQSRTFGDLTELLLQRAGSVVTRQVTGLLQKSYISPYTSYILPLRQLGPLESINIEWNEINFDPALMPQLETLGVGRYFKHNKSRHGARALRRGAAVKIESGFFATPEGQAEWKLQIEQLVTAIQTTNEYDVLLTLLQTPMRRERVAQDMGGPWNHYYGVQYDMSFEDRMIMERDMFALVNKTPDSRGFQALCTNLRTIMARRGLSPDTMIVPPYMLGFYHYTKPDLYEYQSAGPGVQKNRNIAYDIGDKGPVRSETFQGMRLIDTYIYRPVQGSRESATDLLTVPFQIGEFYPMETLPIYKDSKSFQNYRSADRDVRIFNEDQSRIVTVHFKDALKNTYRFVGEADQMVLDSNRHEYNNLESDMFLFGNNKQLCTNWGDMDDEYLSNKYIENVMLSIKHNTWTEDDIKRIQKILGTVANASSSSAKGKVVASTNNELDTLFISKLNNVVNTTSVNVISSVTVNAIVEKTFDSVDFLFNSADPKLKNTGNKQRFKNLIEPKDPMERAIIIAFLTSRITYDNMEKMHDNDIFVPVDIILARPYMTYNMSSVVVMRAGSETGETIIGHQDFQMSSNTQDRTLEASYVYYAKAIVKNTRNVIIAPRVFCQEYVRGNNTKFVSEETLQSQIQRDSGVRAGDESLIAMMVPVGHNSFEKNWIDFRGHNKNVRDNAKDHGHASRSYYENLFQIDDASVDGHMDNFIDYEDMDYQMNTVCWLGHVEYGRDFKEVNQNTGHLGPEMYQNSSRKPGIFAPVKQLTFNTRSVA